MERKETKVAKDDREITEIERANHRAMQAAIRSGMWAMVWSPVWPFVMDWSSLEMNEKFFAFVSCTMIEAAFLGANVGAFVFRGRLASITGMAALMPPCIGAGCSGVVFASCVWHWEWSMRMPHSSGTIARFVSVLASSTTVVAMCVCLWWYYQATHGGRRLLDFSRRRDCDVE